jgi:hypothetical protein
MKATYVLFMRFGEPFHDPHEFRELRAIYLQTLDFLVQVFPFVVVVPSQMELDVGGRSFGTSHTVRFGISQRIYSFHDDLHSLYSVVSAFFDFVTKPQSAVPGRTVRAKTPKSPLLQPIDPGQSLKPEVEQLLHIAVPALHCYRVRC